MDKDEKKQVITQFAENLEHNQNALAEINTTVSVEEKALTPQEKDWQFPPTNAKNDCSYC